MVTEHLIIDSHQKLDTLTKNKGKTMIFDPHNQLIWVIMSLTIVGLFQFPLIIIHNTFTYMVTEHLFIHFHPKLDTLTKYKSKTMIFDHHNQSIWVIMSSTIVALFQFPLIIIHDIFIYGY